MNKFFEDKNYKMTQDKIENLNSPIAIKIDDWNL